MKSTQLALLLLAAAPALAAKYDPDGDRAALRSAANASYDAAGRAAGLPLETEKAADIKASLDECLARAGLASAAAKSLETAAGQRSNEMDGALKGHGAPAPDAAAKDSAAAAAVQRARWKSLSADRDELQSRVKALPDQNPDGKSNKEDLNAALQRAAASLTAADRALGQAEAGAATAADSAGAMALARHRALESDGERAAADGEVVRQADALLPSVSDAKNAVDLLGTEPQSVNRTHAGDKLGAARELARQLDSAADRACNRADDFRSRSDGFDRAQAAFSSASSDGAAALAAAKAALDDADKTQTAVRDRLDHPKS